MLAPLARASQPPIFTRLQSATSRMSNSCEELCSKYSDLYLAIRDNNSMS